MESSEASSLVQDTRLNAKVSLASTEHFFDRRGRPGGPREIWKRECRLGHGSFGTVWLEKCNKMHRDTPAVRAVKEIHLQPGQIDSMDYTRELLAFAKFSQPKFEQYFVKSFGWYATADSVFITMAYHQLGDLHQYLFAPLPEIEVKNICEQLLEGLRHMHDNGFAHRDLKPKNVLVTSRGPNWGVKITDFGITKKIQDGQTFQGTMYQGSPGFMAPEMIVKILTGPHYAVDIWSLGAMAYFMLTNRVMLSDFDELHRYGTGQTAHLAPDYSGLEITEEAERLIDRLLARKPADRPNVEEVLVSPWLADLTTDHASESGSDRQTSHVEQLHQSMPSLSIGAQDSQFNSNTWTSEPSMSSLHSQSLHRRLVSEDSIRGQSTISRQAVPQVEPPRATASASAPPIDREAPTIRGPQVINSEGKRHNGSPRAQQPGTASRDFAGEFLGIPGMPENANAALKPAYDKMKATAKAKETRNAREPDLGSWIPARRSARPVSPQPSPSQPPSTSSPLLGSTPGIASSERSFMHAHDQSEAAANATKSDTYDESWIPHLGTARLGAPSASSSEFPVLDAYDPLWREHFGQFLNEKSVTDEYIKNNQWLIVDLLRKEQERTPGIRPPVSPQPGPSQPSPKPPSAFRRFFSGKTPKQSPSQQGDSVPVQKRHTDTNPSSQARQFNEPRQTAKQRVSVRVVPLSGDAFSISVALDGTVMDMMQYIEKFNGIPADQQRLMFGRETMEPNALASQYGLQEGSTIHLILHLRKRPREGEVEQIYIKTLTGKTIPVHIDLNKSILQLKGQIEAQEGIPPDQQRLIFAGKQLEDERSMKFYSIRAGSVVHIVLRLRG